MQDGEICKTRDMQDERNEDERITTREKEGEGMVKGRGEHSFANVEQ